MTGSHGKFSYAWMLNLCLVSYLILFVQAAAFASDDNVIVLDESVQVIDIGNSATYFFDDTQKITYQNVTKPEFRNKFEPINMKSPNFGFMETALWVRFSLLWSPKDVREINERHWVIEQSSPFIDLVELYDEGPNGELKILRTGDQLDFSEREYDYPLHLFTTTTQPYIKKTIYMRFESNGAMRFGLKIRSVNGVVKHLAHHQLVMGIVFGFMFIMAIYNFSLSLALKASIFLYFSLYISFFFIFRLGVEGYLHQYVFTSGGVFLDQAETFFAGLALIFYIKFFSKFLLQEKLMPWLRAGSNIFLSAAIFATAMVYVLHGQFFVGAIMGWIALVSLSAAIIVSCYCWYIGIKPALYFLLGNICLMVGVLFTVLLDNAYADMNANVAYGQYVGIVAQFLLFSHALGQKIADERRNKEEAQQKSVEYLSRYEDIYNNVADGIFRLNSSLKIESANPAFLGFVGCESLVDYKDTFGEDGASMFVNMDEYDKYANMLAAMKSNGEKVDYEIRYNKKSDGIGWGAYTVKLVCDGNDQQKYYEGSFNDISDKKEKEAAEVAKTKAEAIAQAKGRFLATMSHEIRTPMNAIIGFTDIALSRGEMPDKVLEYFTKIRHSSDILLGIINDILDFSKIEAGMLELDRSKFLLKDLIQRVNNMFVEEAKEKSLDFIIHIDPAIPAILIGDQLRLSQIIINLLGNALKFTDKGGVTLRLLAQERRNNAMLIRFEISDTGVGVRNPDDPYLFEAFTQADESTTREFGGSGLGLSICKKLVGLHGGVIGCQSELGKGSTFWFELEIEAPELQVDQIEQFPDFTENLPRIDGKRVLVAEDNKINQVIAMELLTDLGAEPVLTDDGMETLEILASEKIDLVLMDLHMPRMTGKEALKIIKDRGYKVPVVALTADALDIVASDSEHSGFDGYISKPIDMEKFANLLSELL